VTDIGLKGPIDGWEVATKAREKDPSFPIVYMSGAHAEDWASKGVKIHEAFYTLGRYDQVWIAEAPDEKTLMQFALSTPADLAVTETMFAVSRDEASNWLK